MKHLSHGIVGRIQEYKRLIAAETDAVKLFGRAEMLMRACKEIPEVREAIVRSEF